MVESFNPMEVYADPAQTAEKRVGNYMSRARNVLKALDRMRRPTEFRSVEVADELRRTVGPQCSDRLIAHAIGRLGFRTKMRWYKDADGRRRGQNVWRATKEEHNRLFDAYLLGLGQGWTPTRRRGGRGWGLGSPKGGK